MFYFLINKQLIKSNSIKIVTVKHSSFEHLKAIILNEKKIIRKCNNLDEKQKFETKK